MGQVTPLEMACTESAHTVHSGATRCACGTTERPLPAGWRPATSRDAREWQRGDIVSLWDGIELRTGIVRSWKEASVRVAVVAPYAGVAPEYVALEVWDPDLETGPAYAPRTRDGRLTGVVYG